MTRAGGADRRRHVRLPAADLAWLQGVRLRPGLDAALVDLSPGGALGETGTRLRPRMKTELQLTTGGGQLRASGELVRAWVSAIVPGRGVRYRGALRFDRRLDLPAGNP